MKISKQAYLAVAGVVAVLFVGQVLGQDWPQWRGPGRDGKAAFKAPEAWPKALAEKWRVNVGAGDSSPVLVGDKVYICARVGGDEVTRCLNAADGKEIWADKFPVAAISGAPSSDHSGPRATPAVGGAKSSPSASAARCRAWMPTRVRPCGERTRSRARRNSSPPVRP